jgi:UDP-glucose 4-epimerase
LSAIRNSIKAGVKQFIYFSSAAVKAKPLTPYAVSKISAEEIVNLYANDIRTVIVRPENIYGTGQNKEYGYVIHKFIENIKKAEPVTIYGDGLQSRDFIYIDDVVNTVSALLGKDVREPLSLGTGKSVNVKDLAEIIGKLLKAPVKIDYEDKRIEPRESIADVATLKKNGIDSKKFLTLKEGIDKLIRLEYSNTFSKP